VDIESARKIESEAGVSEVCHVAGVFEVSSSLQRAESVPESCMVRGRSGDGTATSSAVQLKVIGGSSVERYKGRMYCRTIPTIQLTQDEGDIIEPATLAPPPQESNIE